MTLTDRIRRMFADSPVVDDVQPPGTVWLGRRVVDRRAQYIPDAFHESHWSAMGATRSGKTARFIYPMIKQRMERNDGPIVVGDLKGEDWLFHAVMDLAETQGRPFKWFSNVPYFSTYLFNPLNQPSFDQSFVPQLAQVLNNSLNLEHGFAYGRFYFSSKSRRLLAAALELRPTGDPLNAWMPTTASYRIRSFDELQRRVVELAKKNKEAGDAEHLVMILEDLAKIMQIGFMHEGRRLPKPAVDQAICMSELLNRDSKGVYPVYYYYLRTGMESVGSSQIMKLATHSALTALVQARDFFKLGRREQPVPDVWWFLDEWQNIADQSLKGIIETASGFGMRFVFANQDPSQLKNSDIDLSATIWENAGNKVIFTARDPELQKCLMEVSGERTEHVPSYAISHPAWKAGKVTPDKALHVLNGQWAPIHVTQRQVPRIDRDALISMSTSENQFLYIPAYAAPEHGLDGFPILLEGAFAMSQTDYETFRNRGWLAPTPETIVPAEIAKADHGGQPSAA